MRYGAIKIAVADDHERFRKALCAHLSRMDFQVCIEASNGKDLISQLQSSAISPALIIVDMNMPVLNGAETIRLIRKEWTDLPVLALSIHDDADIIRAALNAGATRFIAKGGDPVELKNVLLQMLG